MINSRLIVFLLVSGLLIFFLVFVTTELLAPALIMLFLYAVSIIVGLFVYQFNLTNGDSKNGDKQKRFK